MYNNTIKLNSTSCVCVRLCVQPVRRENTGWAVHKTVRATTMGPATVSQAAAAALLDTMVTSVNTVRKASVIRQNNQLSLSNNTHK